MMMKSIVGAVFLGLAVLPTAASAQTADRKPLKLVVGYPAGGGLDAATRLLAESLRTVTGNNNIIVENRPGAASLIAAQAVATAPPDGTTFLVAPISVTAVHPFIFQDLKFDPNADLVPVAELGIYRYGLAVNPNVPATNVDEFVKWTKSNPGKVNFATLGTGSFAQLLGLIFNDSAAIDMVEIPYKGSAPGLIDLRAGVVQATFDTNASLTEQHKGGAIRILATTGQTRSPQLPEVPTFAELTLNLGPIRDAEFWYGVFAPKNTPKDVVENLNASIVRALASPEVIERLGRLDIVPRPKTVAEFSNAVARDTKLWSQVVKNFKSKIEATK